MDRQALRRIVRIPADSLELEGAFESPPGARGLVVFAHGSGSSRMSPRNRYVAIALHQAGFATLLLDLLTEQEDADRARRFDIALLSRRLLAAVRWARTDRACAGLPIALFGASTGAAAALEVAAALGPDIGAVVSRGGRPDLAPPGTLGRVAAPTLLIVGGADATVIGLNELAYAQLACARSLKIVPGATHLFEEPGALEAVAGLAAQWFARHLAAPGRAAAPAGTATGG
ncbi:MAG TPA: dienelactone hydrolase family protein [Myxococcota bacterium]|nr:dienelactone hydrolase family protein [Myxococcota bacterium]